ncbi:hypothetical protein SORBI_3008G036350 [Sorghum bicolor]|uniref:Uncharacterized protein n=1 Tax=Sorghum bicolor TaxID=4558 RepID=A0A1Z5R5J7_SORBI|nr:hypothetical protein SORBI_3008G036350 [Sorghum bicolor]
MLASACLSAYSLSSSPSTAATHGFLVPSGNPGRRRRRGRRHMMPGSSSAAHVPAAGLLLHASLGGGGDGGDRDLGAADLPHLPSSSRRHA